VNDILNISAYKFVTLDDAAVLRDALHARGQALGLKGTILLATEGINLFLAGGEDSVRAFVASLRQDARFADLEPKESWSATQPFGKFLVKVKGEIIRMNHPAIQPQAGRAPAVDALTVRRWLDAGHAERRDRATGAPRAPAHDPPRRTSRARSANARGAGPADAAAREHRQPSGRADARL